MKLFDGRLDLSCVNPDTVFDASGFEKEALNLLPQAIQSFADMAAEKLVAGCDDTWNECMGVGLSRAEREQLVIEQAAHYLRTAPAADLRAIRKYVRKKLREYAVSAWLQSHHRN